MTEDRSEHDLDDMATDWTELSRAVRNTGNQEAARQAQENLLLRYSSAIRRYVRVAFRDANNVDEIYQDFATRFVEGGFRHVNRSRGRFRDYLKTALFRLVLDFKTKAGRFPSQWSDSYPEPAMDAMPSEEDEQFRVCWRDELLSRAWRNLEERQRQDGLPFAAVLRYGCEKPKVRSEAVARHFSKQTGRNITATNVRKTRMLARQFFEDALLVEVAQTLEDPSIDNLEEELCELGIHTWCLKALVRWKMRSEGGPSA